MITTKTQVICVFVFVVSLFGAWLWLVFWQPPVSSLAHTTTTTFSQPLVTTTAPVEYFSSFGDSFSGTAWLDQEKTTLTRDSSAMVFSFQPNFEWQSLGDCSKMTAECQLVDSSLAKDKFCLKDKCLYLEADRLIYNHQPLVLPLDNQTKLINLTVSLLADRWLIGGVQKIAEKQYQPLAWLFDGRSFEAVKLLDKIGQPVTSQYLGYLAAGGRAESFLVLYSAYDGLAWQVNGSEIRDLSHFFGIRINAGGFRPKIIYSEQGSDTTWYVFNQSAQPVRWLKFWQNKTAWIEGGLDLSKELPIDSQSAHFVANGQKLLAKTVDSREQAKLWLVNDLGFIAPANGQIVSVSLNTYDKVKPRIVGAILVDAIGGWSGIDQQWSLSADGQNWQNVELGQRLDFIQPAEELWWRWQVSSSTNQWQSPCLKKITINYYRL